MSVTPDFVGQVYKDTNIGNIWRANSTTPGDWGLELQNVQCMWEGVDQKFGEKVGFSTSGDLPGITLLTFLGTTSLAGFSFSSTDTLTELNFTNLVSIDPTADQYGSVFIYANTGLDTVAFPILITVAGDFTIISNDILSAVNAPELTTVGGTLDIYENNFTSGLSFPSLVSVGYDFDCSTDNLPSLSIPLLQTVGRDFNCSGNSIPNVSAPSLVSVGRDCFIGSDNVTQVSAAFAALETVGRDLACVGSQLTTISFPALESVTQFLTCNFNTSCTSLTFPSLQSAGILEFNNSGYVTLSFPALTALTGNVNCSACALNAASVNGILATLVAIAAYGAGKTVNLSGGTNAAPSGQGIADKATLQGRGATVLTN